MKPISFSLCTALAAAISLSALTASPSAADATARPFSNPWRPGQFALLQVLALPAQTNTQQAPNAEAALGHALFYDTQLNPATGLGCVSCHQPARAFSDGLTNPAGNPLKRNSPGLQGAAQQRWQFWDGRADSLWSQTLGPLYAPHEIGLSPEQLLTTLDASARYRQLYSEAYGVWPATLPRMDSPQADDMQAKIGSAIAAFVAELKHQTAPFDHYVHALSRGDSVAANSAMTQEAQTGLAVLLKSNCISCHRGRAFSDGDFHNIGTSGADASHDSGRAEGLRLWQQNPFNCASAVAKRLHKSCNLGVQQSSEISRLSDGAFKTPSLRGLIHTAPYTHNGQQATLEDVIEHYRQPPDSDHGLSDMGSISGTEARQLRAFLQALSAPIDTQAWYNKPPTEH